MCDSTPKEPTLMVYVGIAPSAGLERLARRFFSADMGCPMPDPPISDDEMQPIVHAAKMALAGALRLRRKAARKAKEQAR